MVMRRSRTAILHHCDDYYYQHHCRYHRLLLLITLSSFGLRSSDGLQLIQSWQTPSTNTNKKGASILAITSFPIVVDIENNGHSSQQKKQEQVVSVVATAGHEGGKVRLWMLPPRSATTVTTFTTTSTKDLRNDHVVDKETPAFQTFDLHEGSIFALLHFRTTRRSKEKKTNSQQYLVSGSFDRTSALHRIVAKTTSTTTATATTTSHRLLSPNNMIDTTIANPMANSTAATTTTADSFLEHCTLALESIGSLPEHTGWVRGVQGMTFHNNNNNNNNQQSAGGKSDKYLLSIGCNLINVWTIVVACSNDDDDDDHDNDTVEQQEKEQPRNVVVRVARFDAGPSPGDPPSEPFRRHDILCLAIVERVNNIDSNSNSNSNMHEKEKDDVVADDHSSKSPPWIVAGLVDGTIRVFDVNVPKWSHRQIASPYDATGSCTRTFVEKKRDDDDNNDDDIPDDAPRLAVRAHQGRITGIHSIPDRPREFISVGHDGRWIQWQIQGAKKSLDDNDDKKDTPSNGGGMEQDSELTLLVIAEGCVPAAKEDDNDENNDAVRICSSVISKGKAGQCVLIVGTTGGYLYEINASPVMDGKETKECREIWRDRNGNVKVTALTSMDCHDDGYRTAIVAGTSSGSVLVFKE